MKEPGETAILRRRRGSAKNSQAKGPALDETLESIEKCTEEVTLSGKSTERRSLAFALFFCLIRQVNIPDYIERPANKSQVENMQIY